MVLLDEMLAERLLLQLMRLLDGRFSIAFTIEAGGIAGRSGEPAGNGPGCGSTFS